ncbi:MAG TPA: hydroxyacid dehydrogenase [Tepidisphaeraceae bacterium]|jgi:phosphoglycerate dehydrogenase-like enzyme
MKMRGLYLLCSESYDLVYGRAERERIAQLVDVCAAPQTAESVQKNPAVLADAEIIFSGWGMPLVDDAFLDNAPHLRAIFYAAGTVGFWAARTPERGVVITSAQHANAVPVAEYALATILFSLKHGWRLARQTRAARTFVARNDVPGCYRRTVGLISLGVIARLLIERLRPFDLHVLVYDPFLSDAEAQELGVERASLDELFRRSDVTSLHTPSLPETQRIITGDHFASMPPGATFINTARGEIVREEEMIDLAMARPDLQFVLDVTFPEPPGPQSPLYTLPNVVLTPHIAGSAGPECQRMGRYMVEELERYVAGRPLQWQVTPPARNSSHHKVASRGAKDQVEAGHVRLLA